MVQDFHKGNKPYTHARAENKLGRALVDLGAPKMLESIRRNRYTGIVCDDFLRHTWL